MGLNKDPLQKKRKRRGSGQVVTRWRNVMKCGKETGTQSGGQEKGGKNECHSPREKPRGEI